MSERAGGQTRVEVIEMEECEECPYQDVEMENKIFYACFKEYKKIIIRCKKFESCKRILEMHHPPIE